MIYDDHNNQSIMTGRPGSESHLTNEEFGFPGFIRLHLTNDGLDQGIQDGELKNWEAFLVELMRSEAWPRRINYHCSYSISDLPKDRPPPQKNTSAENDQSAKKVFSLPKISPPTISFDSLKIHPVLTFTPTFDTRDNTTGAEENIKLAREDTKTAQNMLRRLGFVDLKQCGKRDSHFERICMRWPSKKLIPDHLLKRKRKSVVLEPGAVYGIGQKQEGKRAELEKV